MANWRAIIPWALALTGCCVALGLYIGNPLTKLHLAHAEGQIAMFEDMRQKAQAAADATEVAGYLDYVVSYYPSGTKHATGSRLDRIVEASRATAVREIVGRLRVITNDDLGEQPQPWIDKYARK